LLTSVRWLFLIESNLSTSFSNMSIQPERYKWYRLMVATPQVYRT
jgi:hypothetical protein